MEDLRAEFMKVTFTLLKFNAKAYVGIQSGGGSQIGQKLHVNSHCVDAHV